MRTCGNVPKLCKCSICLFEFAKTDQTIHLPSCYHYYHKYCLATHIRYIELDIEAEKLEAKKNKIKWKERSVCCPVCREPINSSIISELNSFNSKNTSNKEGYGDNLKREEIVISDKMRHMQIEMRRLFEKQKLAGGIIENKEQEIIVLNVFYSVFYIKDILGILLKII